MPRQSKPRKVGRPRKEAEVSPELVEALSLAGIPRKRIAELVGLSEIGLVRKFGGTMKRGPKVGAARVAVILERAVMLAERAATPFDIPAVLAVVKLLAPLHLPELAKSWQPPKEADDDLPPVSPSIGYKPEGGP